MQAPKLIKTVTDMRAFRGQLSGPMAFVPTMGNLHQGHLALVEKAQQVANNVIVSIFVNPTQFGPGEDFAEYPRTLEADLEKLSKYAIQAVFLPHTEEIYTVDLKLTTVVQVPEIGRILCGISRPHHFSGVATVVASLFNIVQPNFAVFGEKDYQQVLIIKKMVKDLHFPVEIITLPTVREADGLALSSRNQYLTPAERDKASHLFHILNNTKIQIVSGQRNYAQLSEHAMLELQQQGFTPDYFSIRRQSDLGMPESTDKDIIILAAAYLGKTRLIDNLCV